MRRTFLIPVFSIVLTAGVMAQQKPSSDPYAPPPAQPKPPSALPDKGCSGSAQSDGKGWKTSSNCAPADSKTSSLATSDDQQPAQQQPKHSTAEDNPFPEDVSRKAADDAAKEKGAEDGAPNAPAASPAAGESSSRTGKMSDADLLGDNNSRISNGAGGVIHDPKMAANDVHVGQFYLNRENYKGAYDRFKEATLVDPENTEAVFYLAESAQRMNLRNEAAQNYQLYLDAMPDGPKAKDAKKALHDLNASAKH